MTNARRIKAARRSGPDDRGCAARSREPLGKKDGTAFPDPVTDGV